MKSVFLAIAMLSSGAGIAAAAAGPTVAESSIEQSALAEAERMLDSEDFESQVMGSADVMLEGLLAVQIERLETESEEPPPEELIASFREIMRSHIRGTMKAKMPQMKRQAAEIYAREFTVDELRRMREIAADPVMVKVREKGQTLSAQLMMVGMTAMKASENDLRQKIEQMVADYLKKAGLTVDEKS